VDGVDYHFVSEDAFRAGLARGDFVEWAVVHGFQYGAAVESVEAALVDGQVMLLDIDVQGTVTWKRALEERCVTVFVLPPSLEVLQERLRGRRTEGKSSYQVRMKNARRELAQADSYDYAVVNDDLDRAVGALRAVIEAERCRPRRLHGLLSGLGVPGPDAPESGCSRSVDSV
jgi:guanylate kinase